MFDLPEPQDDGLFTPVVGPWSQHKHHFLRRYIDAFTTAQPQLVATASQAGSTALAQKVPGLLSLFHAWNRCSTGRCDFRKETMIRRRRRPIAGNPRLTTA